MLAKDDKGLVDLGSQGVAGLEQVKEFDVVHVQEHSGDLSGELGLLLLDVQVEALSEHLLLLGGRGLGEDGSGQGLLRTGQGDGGGAVGLATTNGLINAVAHVVGELVVAVPGGGGTTGTLASERTLAGLHTLGSTANPGWGWGTGGAGTGILSPGPATWATLNLSVRDELRTLAWGTLLGTTPPGRPGHHGVHVLLLLALGRDRVVEHGLGEHRAGEDTRLLGHPHLVTLGVLDLKLLPADLLALSEGDVDGLLANHLAVHLSHGPGGLVRGGEAHEAEAAGVVLLVNSDLGRGDGAEGGELQAELLIIDGVIKVLDVEVDALKAAEETRKKGMMSHPIPDIS